MPTQVNQTPENQIHHHSLPVAHATTPRPAIYSTWIHAADICMANSLLNAVREGGGTFVALRLQSDAALAPAHDA